MPKGFTEVLEKTLSIGESEKRTAAAAGDVRHGQLCREVEHSLWYLCLPKSPVIKQNARLMLGRQGDAQHRIYFLCQLQQAEVDLEDVECLMSLCLRRVVN